VYVAAVGDFLKQFTLANGSLSRVPAHQSSNTFDFRGTTPVVSANGTAAGIVWALDSSAYTTGGPAVLYAYDAANVSNPLSASAGNGTGAAGAAVKVRGADRCQWQSVRRRARIVFGVWVEAELRS
jgi:hypothetical protein